MNTTFDNLDLFCRINVQSEMPHHELVSLIAHSVGRAIRMNSVKSDKVDISVDDNDVFDPEKSQLGKDRWLYFRYTLEIDPIEGVSPRDTLLSLARCFDRLWSSRLDAVASCDFEGQLPRNVAPLEVVQDSPAPTVKAPKKRALGDVREFVSPATGDLVALDQMLRSFTITGLMHSSRMLSQERCTPVTPTCPLGVCMKFLCIRMPRLEPPGMPIAPIHP